MKKIFFFFIVFIVQKTGAQNNVGIGVNSPQSKLHVLNSFRVGGMNNYISYDSSGKIILNNSNVFVPAPQYLLQHSASAEGLFYGNNQLEYRYQDGTPRFSVNATYGDGYFYGMLGLGNQTPLAPIHFAPVTGSKIIFYGQGTEHNYGIDVQPYRLQFHVPAVFSNIGFGYGSSDNFTEIMRLQPYGAVGIGTNSPDAALDVRKISGLPTARFQGSQYSTLFNNGAAEYTYIRGGKNNSKLILNEITRGQVGVGVYPDSDPVTQNFIFDVGGRILIRSGGTLGTTAGTWFTNGASGQGFVGMENDNYIGFFGASAGWKFAMNTQNGALKINGSEGAAGQLLTSNGPNAAASWSSPTQEYYANTIALNATEMTGFHLNWDTIPGMTYTFNTTGKALILARYNLNIRGLECSDFGGADGRHRSIMLDMDVSGSVSSFSTLNEHTLDCDRYTQVTGTFSAKVDAGTHTILFRTKSNGTTGPTVAKVLPHGSPFTSQVIIQIFNE